MKQHSDIVCEGYVGVTNDVKRRLGAHKRGGNSHLSNAFNKYNSDVVCDVILKGGSEYCLMIEAILRPNDNIGWNIAKGGGMPPNQSGVLKSSDQKKKMSESRRKNIGYFAGDKNPNYGKVGAATGKKWYHDPITKYSSYFTPGEEPDGWILGRFKRTKIGKNNGKC